MPIFRPILTVLIVALMAATVPAPGASALELRSLFKGDKQLEARVIAVDEDAAARMLSAYRKRHGLGPVTIDPTLNRIAADHAVKMAQVGKLSHVVRGEGSFSRRLRTGGYDAGVAAENIGGGYPNLEEAFAGWRKSKPHDKNLLRPEVTVIGIARADAAGSKYGAYWSLVLARPHQRPEGPTAGPSAIPGGLIIGR